MADNKSPVNVFQVFAKLGIDTSDYEDALKKAARESESFGDKVLNALGTVGKSLGGSLVEAGKLAISTLEQVGKYSVQVGMDFEKQMDKVAAISGADAEQLDTLSEKAKEMGQTTIFSATEAGKAFEYMAMAGWKTDEMLAGVAGVMNLAAASGEDLGRTSDIVTDALTAFGLKAGDAGHFADVLAAAATNANTNVGIMGETFKYAAPVAGALGFSIEDVAVATGLMANAGVKGSQAGTSLRTMFTNLSKATEENVNRGKRYLDVLGMTASDIKALETETAGYSKIEIKQRKALAEAAKEMGSLEGQVRAMTKAASINKESISNLEAVYAILGIQTTDSEGNMRDLGDIMQEVRAATDGLSEADQTFLAKTIAGQEAMSGFMAIINASEEDYSKLSYAIADCAGSAETMAQTMTDNLAGSITLAKSAAESFGIEIYETVGDKLKGFVNLGTDSLNQLTNAFKTDGVEGMVAAAGDIIDNIINYINEQLPDLMEAGSGVLSGLLQGIIDNIGTVIDEAVHIINTLCNTLMETDTVDKLIEAGIEILFSLIEGIIDALPSLLEAAIDIIIKLCFALLEPDNVHRLIITALNLVLVLVEGIIEALPKLIRAATDIILGLVKYITDPSNLKEIFNVAAKIIFELAAGLLAAALELLVAIGTIIEEVIEAIFNTDWGQVGVDVVKGIWDGLKEAWKNVTKWFSDVFGSIGKAASNLWDKITGKGSGDIDIGIDDSDYSPEPRSSRGNYNIESGGNRKNTYSRRDIPVIVTKLNIDGREVAESTYNPLNDINNQRGDFAYAH